LKGNPVSIGWGACWLQGIEKKSYSAVNGNHQYRMELMAVIRALGAEATMPYRFTYRWSVCTEGDY
jgi:ribonuclease HI